MLEVGREKMKVSDEQNRQALGNIDPKQPSHLMGLTGKSRQRQFSSRAEGGPAPSIFVEQDSWRQPALRLLSICCCLENVDNCLLGGTHCWRDFFSSEL